MNFFKITPVAIFLLLGIIPNTLGSEAYEDPGKVFTLEYGPEWVVVEPDSKNTLKLNFGENDQIVAIIAYNFSYKFPDFSNEEFYTEVEPSVLYNAMYPMWGSMGDFQTDYIEKGLVGNLQGYIGSFTLTFGKNTNRKGQKMKIFLAVTIHQGYMYSVFISAFPEDLIDVDIEANNLLLGLSIHP